MLTDIINVMNCAPQFRQEINVDQRMRFGRMMFQDMANLLHN